MIFAVPKGGLMVKGSLGIGAKFVAEYKPEINTYSATTTILNPMFNLC